MILNVPEHDSSIFEKITRSAPCFIDPDNIALARVVMHNIWDGMGLTSCTLTKLIKVSGVVRRESVCA